MLPLARTKGKPTDFRERGLGVKNRFIVGEFGRYGIGFKAWMKLGTIVRIVTKSANDKEYSVTIKKVANLKKLIGSQCLSPQNIVKFLWK